MKKYFAEKGWIFDKIIIESSPFLRSMQTAAWTVSELEKVSEITIRYRISENITSTNEGSQPLDWHFKENPIPQLEFIKSGCSFK